MKDRRVENMEDEEVKEIKKENIMKRVKYLKLFFFNLIIQNEKFLLKFVVFSCLSINNRLV
jgi:hypothetical protein